MELFAARGFENVTVAEIAAHAGLNPRTFYRYFGDKQEVLFSGSDAMNDELARALGAAAPTLPPLGAVAEALAAVTRLIGGDHAHSVRRRAIIMAHTDLQERESTKLAGWARALVEALQHRGVDDRTAALAAESGMAVFRYAFDQWTGGTGEPELAQVLSESFEQLRALATAG